MAKMPPKDYREMPPDPDAGLVECPKCGKTGLLQRYRDGSAIIFHKVEYGFANCPQITVSCFFRASQVPA